MSLAIISILAAIGLTALTIFADALIKKASLQDAFIGWKLLTAGAFFYGATAFGWFFLMRKSKLATLGVLYAVLTIILLILLSVFYFKEKINSFEVLGIVLAIVSLIILYRFA